MQFFNCLSNKYNALNPVPGAEETGMVVLICCPRSQGRRLPDYTVSLKPAWAT